MVFTSPLFLFGFLAAVLALYALLPDRSTMRWRDKLEVTDVVLLVLAEHRIGSAPHFEHFLDDALAALR